MEKTVKVEFARRIASANKTQLVVILFEMCFAYMEDAQIGRKKEDHATFKEGVQRASKCLSRLKADLDFTYPIAKQLYSLYQFSLERLAASLYRYDLQGIKEAQRVLQPIYEAFEQLAKADQSQPMMEHTQKVYAGMTYNRGNLSENLVGEAHRGFLV